VCTNGFLTADRLSLELMPRIDRRSVYSCLLGLERRGFLKREPNQKVLR
jgi:hypothetical protein